VGIKMLGYLFPTTPMLPAFLKLRIMGGDYGSVRNEIMILLAQLGGYFILAMLSLKLSAKRNTRVSLRFPEQ
jgi:ABC-2 type transport system permease protein